MKLITRTVMSSALAAVAVMTVTITPVMAADSTADADMIKRGLYIARLGGCNDCHTKGYLMNEGKVPVDQWLKGSDFGWRGPWGTTYPPNLRLFVSKLTEDEWVEKAKTLKRRPPMPWFNLNTMTETDLRALYRFIRSLGDPGPQAPEFVPPGEEPHTAYALFPSPPPEAK